MEVLLLCRNAVSIFYSPSWLGNRTLVVVVGSGGSFPSAEMQSVYSTAPADWATGHSFVGGGLTPSAAVQSVYFTAPADWTTGHSLVVVVVVLPSAEMQSEYSTAPADWATGHSFVGVGLTPLQRYSQYILQLQPIGPQDTRCCWWWWGGLPLSRDAVSIFYSPSRLGNRTLICWSGSYPSAAIQSVYFTAPVDWTTGHSLVVVVVVVGSSPQQRCSQYILQPQPIGQQDTHLLEWVLPLCSDTVSIFYSSSRLDHRTLVVVVVVVVGSSPQQRCSQNILQPQLIGPQDTCFLEGVLQRCSRCIL